MKKKIICNYLNSPRSRLHKIKDNHQIKKRIAFPQIFRIRNKQTLKMFQTIKNRVYIKVQK